MKRQYSKPTIETLNISTEQSLLQAASISVASEGYDSSMSQLSKENKGFDIWGEDEEE